MPVWLDPGILYGPHVSFADVLDLLFTAKLKKFSAMAILRPITLATGKIEAR